MAFFLLTALLVNGCTARNVPTNPAPGRVGNDGRGDGAEGEHVAEGSLHGRTGALLTVRDAAGLIEVRTADLPGRLYRITTPAGSGLAPQVEGPDGRPRLRLRPTGGEGRDSVRILLNRTVRWDIRLPAGGGEQRLDLRDGRLAGVRLGAAALVELNLPGPDRAVPIVLSGAVGDLAVTTPPGTPLRWRLAQGAARVGRRAAGPGEVIVSPGWAGARRRYSVDARESIGKLTARTAGAERAVGDAASGAGSPVPEKG